LALCVMALFVAVLFTFMVARRVAFAFMFVIHICICIHDLHLLVLLDSIS
jgi:hypothetical protein